MKTGKKKKRRKCPPTHRTICRVAKSPLHCYTVVVGTWRAQKQRFFVKLSSFIVWASLALSLRQTHGTLPITPTQTTHAPSSQSSEYLFLFPSGRQRLQRVDGIFFALKNNHSCPTHTHIYTQTRARTFCTQTHTLSHTMCGWGGG